MYRLKILADGVGITDFNDGSKVKALVQSNADIVSSISMDFKEAIYNAIPIALYESLGFTQLPATNATGYLRPYRKPQMIIRYVGSGSSAKITITNSLISAACVGAPGDAFSFDFTTYPKTGTMYAAINALSGWSCTLIADVDCTSLYKWTAKEVIGEYDYTRTLGFDCMLATDIAIPVATGYSVTLNEVEFITTADGTILAGTSGVACPAQCTVAGTAGNIEAGAIDTEMGQGTINSSIDASIVGVTNDTAFSGGANQETANARRLRFNDTISALNAGTKQGIINALRTISGVKNVGMRTSYPFRGTNTIILDDGTQTISAALLASAEKILYGDPDDLVNYPGKNAEGIGYVFVAPTIVSVSIGITATRLSNIPVDLTTIQTDIVTAVEQYINTLQLGRDVLLSEVFRVAKNSNNAIYDMAIVSPSANISINQNEFARTGSGTGGTVTVTVTISGTE